MWMITVILTLSIVLPVQALPIDITSRFVGNATDDNQFYNFKDIANSESMLIDHWQDDILSILILVNHLNILLIDASRSDFILVSKSESCSKYIARDSFRLTAYQLSTRIQAHYINIYEDVNRFRSRVESIDTYLKASLLLIKHGNQSAIETAVPNLLVRSENILNRSLSILANSSTRFQEIHDFLVELDSYLSKIESAFIFTFQIQELKAQWQKFSDLFTHLSSQAERSMKSIFLQLNWVLQEFARVNNDGSNQKLITDVLLAKTVEIDHIIDLINLVVKIFETISSKYVIQKLTSNQNYVHMSQEDQRLQLIKQHRYQLQAEVVDIARIALTNHNEYVKHDLSRNTTFDQFLNETSARDMYLLLSSVEK